MDSNWILQFSAFRIRKIIFVGYLAIALKDYKKFKNLIEPAIFVMICIVFMVLQKALGAALIFFGIAITMMYIATFKFKYIAASLVFLMGG